MNKPKKIGTAAETAVARRCAGHGIAAQRVALHGVHDQGDVHLWGGLVVIEVKSRKDRPSARQIEVWMGELERECMRVPQCSAGALVVKTPGVGPANAGDWLAYLRADEWDLIASGGSPRVHLDIAPLWVAVPLDTLCEALLRVPKGVL